MELNSKKTTEPPKNLTTTPRRIQGPIRISRTEQLDEVTARTEQGRFLLRPSERANQMILGCIGRAQQRYPVRIHGFVFMSNHYHLLASADDAKQLSDFTGYVNGNVTRELNRLTGWHGPMWRRRFRAIAVDCDEVTQRSRLRYLLSHGIKEGLVTRARDWPGASSLPWMLDGAAVIGTWVDRTSMALDCKRGISKPEEDYETEIELQFAPMPCFAGATAREWRAEIAAIVADIEAEHAEERAAANAKSPGSGTVAGVEAVLAADPFHCAGRPKKRRAPCVHTSNSRARLAWRIWFRDTRLSYYEAAAAYRSGDLSAEFPPGVFRPRGPFVPLCAENLWGFVGPAHPNAEIEWR